MSLGAERVLLRKSHLDTQDAARETADLEGGKATERSGFSSSERQRDVLHDFDERKLVVEATSPI
jgi:hypothetical protein